MENLLIGGKNHISSKRAALLMGYTQDYIGQLCRSGKMRAQRVSGVWYISEDEFPSGVFSSVDGKRSVALHESITDTGEQPNESNILSREDGVMLKGVPHISSKRAALLMGYTQDYIGQLCRGKKIEAEQVGRSWYIPVSIVEAHIGNSSTDVVVAARPQSYIEEISDSKDAVEAQVQEQPFNIRPHTVYSFDETPLVPTPQRPPRQLLHEILMDTEETDLPKVSVVVRVPTKSAQRSLHEPAPSSVHDTHHEPQREVGGRHLFARKPLFVGVVMISVVLAASVALSYAPYEAKFSAETGALTAVVPFIHHVQVDAHTEVASVAQDTSSLEKVITFISGMFASEIEYKAK